MNPIRIRSYAQKTKSLELVFQVRLLERWPKIYFKRANMLCAQRMVRNGLTLCQGLSFDQFEGSYLFSLKISIEKFLNQLGTRILCSPKKISL